MSYLQQAQVVIGGAGYNTVFECVALEIPLIGFPWPRQYDRQFQRGQQWTTVVQTAEDAISVLQDLLQKPAVAGDAKDYVNGIEGAISMIEQMT